MPVSRRQKHYCSNCIKYREQLATACILVLYFVKMSKKKFCQNHINPKCEKYLVQYNRSNWVSCSDTTLEINYTLILRQTKCITDMCDIPNRLRFVDIVTF